MIDIRPFGDPEMAGAEEPLLQELLESDPGYSERITGYPPGPSDALSLLLGRPDGTEDDDKVVLGGWEAGRLVGVLDLIRGYPDADRLLIGLLLVHPDARGRGVGAELLRAADAHRGSAVIARAAIVETNAAVTGFWTAQGFAATGETRPWSYGPVSSISRILERRLPL